MVRAKFRLNSYTTELHQTGHYEERVRVDDGKVDRVWIQDGPVEKRTLNFTPVYGTEPGSENKKFWDASPSGSLQLGVVNKEAWEMFELGKEYYLDFTPA